EELHGTCGHHGLLALQCVCVSDHASIAWPVIQFWGAGWAPYNGSVARQAENWLRAAIYVTAAATSTHMPASSGAGHCNGGVEWHRYRSARRRPISTRPVRAGPQLCAEMAVFHGTSNPQGSPVVCFSSGGASAASRSALRNAAFSSFFLCFSSLRARAALCRSARSRPQFGL